MIWDLVITVITLLVCVWFLFIEPVINRIRSLRPVLPPPRFRPVEEKERTNNTETDNKLLRLLIEKHGVSEPVPVSTGQYRYGPVRGGTDDTTEENQWYQQVRELVQSGYSGNQIVSLMGGSRSRVLELVRRARKEFGL